MEIIIRKEAKELGEKFYYTGKPCKHGHYDRRRTSDGKCLTCAKLRDEAYRTENREAYREKKKKYKAQKKDHFAEYAREYRKNNLEKVREIDRLSRERHRDSINKRQRERYQANIEEMRNKRNEYMVKYSESPYYKCSKALRTSLYRILKSCGTEKSESTVNLVGYSPSDLLENIRDKFLDGMSWDNYGEWHIDHKNSIHYFVNNGVTDPAIIHSLDNLIPMWAEHNFSKHRNTLLEWLESKGRDSEEYQLYSRFL